MSIEIPKQDAKELACNCNFDDYLVVRNEQVDTLRWVSVHELVIKVVSTNKFYRTYYEKGLTEYQEGCDMFDSDPVTFKECVPRVIETVVYDNA